MFRIKEKMQDGERERQFRLEPPMKLNGNIQVIGGERWPRVGKTIAKAPCHVG